ncbi:MAG: septum site-determining protein MinC [Clostridium sp.]|uniref:septum site-determining protein MinC n=1 Tax=Clostridium sp. TaxID=1506 RepID=UPI003069AC7F
MQDEGIKLKGEKDGLNLNVDIKRFSSMDHLIATLRGKLDTRRKFLSNSSIKMTIELAYLDARDLRTIRSFLYDEFTIKDCTFVDTREVKLKTFNGVIEGKTKFVKKTIRSGQRFEYSGNVVIVGDINSGAEVYAEGNIIVLGVIKGCVYAGSTGNNNAIIAAFELTPQIMKISNVITRSPEDIGKPKYPEVAKIKNGNIVVEPYLVNKYI